MNAAQFIEHFHFLRPLYLLLLPVLALLWLALWRGAQQGSELPTGFAAHLAKVLMLRSKKHGLISPLASLCLLAGLAILALSGPSWQRQASPLIEDEAILLIALDVSASMQQSDVQPSRLERARQKILDLLALRAGARSGLIVYAGSAHSVIPITNDMDIVSNFLHAVGPDTMPLKGKAAAEVLTLADSLFRQSASSLGELPGTLLLITDGVSDAAQAAYADYFSENRHQLLVWGVGSTEFNSESGQEMPADYRAQDKASLKALASDSDGFYQAFSTDKRDVRRINWRIENHLLFVDDEDRPWIDMGYYLLWPIGLLCLLWFRRGWTVQYALCAAIVLVNLNVSPAVFAQQRQESAQEKAGRGFFGIWLSADQQARYHFERGEYAKAAALFQQPMWRGVAYYLAEDFDNAAAAFSTLDSVHGWFNRANAYAQGRHYLKAVSAYDEVLRRQPEHASALKNRSIVQALVDEINRMSESQRSEPGEASRELGDAPQTADGALRQQWGSDQVEQFSAEQILTDERIQQQWMKQVQQDPSRFLALKFQMQLNQADQHD